MSEPTTPAPTSGASARPVDISERVTLLDVLRGFALCGVLMGNLLWLYTGRASNGPPSPLRASRAVSVKAVSSSRTSSRRGPRTAA